MRIAGLFIALIVLFLVVPPVSGSGEETMKVVVLESRAIKPYEEALQSFKSACKCLVSQVVPLDAPEAQAKTAISQHKPDMILAIGEEAFLAASRFPGIPMVYLFVQDPDRPARDRPVHGQPAGGQIEAGDNGTSGASAAMAAGISMNVDPDKQLSAFLDVLPQVKRIGLLHTPQESRSRLEGMRVAAAQKGITLVERTVTDGKTVHAQLKAIKDEIDALWIIPDPKVVSPEIEELFILFSMENNIPLLAFTQIQSDRGATVSLALDPHDMGLQAAELATGPPVQAQAGRTTSFTLNARSARLSINLPVAMKMHLALNEKYKNRPVLTLLLANLK